MPAREKEKYKKKTHAHSNVDHIRRCTNTPFTEKCVKKLAQTLTLIFKRCKGFTGTCLALSVVIICGCAAFELCCHPQIMK